MRIYLDLDTRRILTTATRPATRLEFKRRDNDAFEVQFLRSAVVQELPVGTTARVGLKATDDFAGEFLATDTLAQSGSGSATVYSGEFNLNTTSLESLFAAEPASLTAMLEVQWQSGTQVGSSLTLPVTIFNDVIRGDEGDPATLPLFYTSTTSDFLATQAEAEAGTDNTKWMSPLRTTEAIAALAGSGGVSSYNDLTDVPSEFLPSTHTHPLSDLTQSAATTGQVATWDGTAWVPQDPSGGGGGGVTSYNDLTDVPATFPPESHTHAISEVANLETALDGKQPAGSYAPATDISPSAITGTAVITTDSRLSDARTPTTHSHSISEVTDLETALDSKQASGSYVTTSGGITAISVVSAMPATPDPNTLYIVTA